MLPGAQEVGAVVVDGAAAQEGVEDGVAEGELESAESRGRLVDGDRRGSNGRRRCGPMLTKVSKWLTPRKRILHPPEVTHTIISDDHPRQHWLRIDHRTDATRSARIRGRILKKNRIEIETENVDAFTVFIDDERLDEKRKIVVTHNGDAFHEGKIEESIDALIESWRGRRDPGLLHSRMIRGGGKTTPD